MSHFIRSQVASMFFGVLVSLVLMLSSFFLLSYGKGLLGSDFYMGAVIIGLVPFIVFCTAFFYQGRVIFPMKQIFVFSPSKVTEIQGMIIKSAKESYILAKWVPVAITVVGALMSITFIPGSIAPYVIGDSEMTHKIVASLIISANFILFIRMVEQIIAAKRSLSQV